MVHYTYFWQEVLEIHVYHIFRLAAFFDDNNDANNVKSVGFSLL